MVTTTMFSRQEDPSSASTCWQRHVDGRCAGRAANDATNNTNAIDLTAEGLGTYYLLDAPDDLAPAELDPIEAWLDEVVHRG